MSRKHKTQAKKSASSFEKTAKTGGLAKTSPRHANTSTSGRGHRASTIYNTLLGVNPSGFQLLFKILLPVFLLAVFILLAYSNTFDASFHFDDTPNIADNRQIRNLANLGEVIKGTDRPVAMIVNALNYHFGKLNVRGYHYVNVGIHILTAIVLYFILLNTFTLPSLLTKYGDRKYFLAIATSLIFALHPIQTQAITYIIQGRMAGLAMLFYLSAMLFFILGTKKIMNYELRITNEKSTNRQSTTDNFLPSSFFLFPFSIFYLLAILAAALGMGTKQIAVTAPVMILLYDYFFIANGNLKELKKRILIHLGLFSTIVVVVYFNITCTKFGAGVGFGVKEFTLFQYLLNQLSVVLYYIFLLVLPLNQNIDHDWHISKSLFELLPIFSFFLIVLILAIAVKLYRRHRLLSFCILWYFITLAPESSIIPIKDVIFEHRVYLPSAFSLLFFILLFSEGLKMLKNKYKIKVEYIGYLIIVVVTISLGILTYQRNAIWKDDITLWGDCVKKSPNKSRCLNNLGIAYGDIGHPEEAIPLLEKTIKVDPKYADAYSNLASNYGKIGQIEKAYPILKKSIRLDPNNSRAYSNLGICYRKMKKPYLAIKAFKKAIKLNPTMSEAYNGLANAHIDIGKFENAIPFYQKAIKFDTSNGNIYKNLGQTYEHIGKYDLALNAYNRLLKIAPNYGEGYVKLGLLYNDKLYNSQKAVYYLTEALKYLNPQEVEKIKLIIARAK